MLDRQQLEAFACVIEHKSFERAASALNITSGAISQRIKSLENSLSTILVIRERPIHPTSAGQALLQHVSALRSLEHDVLRLLSRKGNTNSKIAIGVHPDSLNTWFAPLLIELMRAEQVCVEIISDDRCSSLNILKRGDVQGCVSVVADPLDGFEVHPLGAMEYKCVSTPDYMRRYLARGMGTHSLLDAPAITRGRNDTRHTAFLRELLGVSIERFPCHYLPSLPMVQDAVLAGLGYTLMPADVAAPLLEEGQLVDLMPDSSYREPLYWHGWMNHSVVKDLVGRRIIDTASKSLQPAPC
ncbi:MULTISPECIES: HTH-type transcriptional regulator ArgP [Pseudomonas]|uniref:HTH-type transcriptional regulator ArgP n=1 Tax=Pseudomonas TaxID=286 RepID=UPI0008762B89|nr:MULTISPECIES: HTH-type transcriptional regulator ArgP [Pseudomonas]MDB6444056.1 HTH-type transcriptional regulator ArgP [Pseudomonas sp. 21TX0197]MDT8908840.1 HTH-type transcriptional regulator ArgP [Pseudomonas prosekii]NHN66335.1 ArgP/LysG family DNA-binding transcriptional regulator [Pseudomonas fluorescens]ROO39955.1 transcriptional regulator ArgP [Pseudomonas sp. AF76]ROO41427.1 transcriptional regulator ArgP [Pseudomonas sp. 7SR1]